MPREVPLDAEQMIEIEFDAVKIIEDFMTHQVLTDLDPHEPHGCAIYQALDERYQDREWLAFLTHRFAEMVAGYVSCAPSPEALENWFRDAREDVHARWEDEDDEGEEA